MKILFTLLTIASICPSLVAQTAPQVVHLWENGAPGFESRKDIPEQAQDYWVRNVNDPSITVFLPPKDKANGTAVVIAPGGGFRELVFNAEGVQAAQFFNSIGVAAFALKYRLPGEPNSPYTKENVRQDAYRAIRLVRSRAQEWGIDPHRVGMLGFSAGGEVVSMVAYAPGDGDPAGPDPIDRLNGRPDFQMMVYPGGGVPDTVPANAPPAFLLVADDDQYGCDKVTLQFYEKLHAAGVPVEAIFLPQGKHAFNMGDRSKLVTVNTWPQRMADWMKDSGYLAPATPPPAAPPTQ
ncbi:MAG TPA: alpha/beta hydrolase [Terracidiphilus sp.]|nr:alpha/beta hydrolase [Terracidiphilus sp.]